MSSPIKTYIRPRSLTHCVLDNSLSGRFKHFLWRHGLNRKRARRHGANSNMDPSIRACAAELREKGIVVGKYTDFLSDTGTAAFKSSEQFMRAKLASDEIQAVLEERDSHENKNYLVHVVHFTEQLDPDHPLLRLALDERLLSTVAAYMDMWPQLHAIGSWYNFPVQQDAKASQLWHRDPEDLKTVKVFIYLDDVEDRQGPFSYISGSHPFGADCTLDPQHEHPRRVRDPEIEKTFPKNRWMECKGPAGTMIIADTVGFHRGGQVQEGHRLLVTFTYTSGVPQQERKLKLKADPTWQLSPIQKYALKD